MSKKIENARNLYLEGINQGKPTEALDKYIGDKYTQHSAGVADGKEGFLEFFIPFLERNPVRDIKIIRAIEDGPYVFVHAHQSLNNGQYYYITADIFDTDAHDRIIEHWDVIQEEVKDTASGRSMIDGPTEVEDLEQTENNRNLIQRFYDQVVIPQEWNKASEFINPDYYHQHSPMVADGLSGLQQFITENKNSGNTVNYVKVHKLVVQGNFAAALCHTQIANEDWCIIDIYRIKNGRIEEHWDAQEKILPKDQWNNSGKF